MKRIAKILKIALLIPLVLTLVAALLFGKKDIPIEILKQKYTSAESAFVEVDGMQVHYRMEGKVDSADLPIVLLHGTGASLHTWDGWVAALKDAHRLIRLDLPAYGLTGASPHRMYTQDFYAAFVAHFLTKTGVKRCILGGNSLGGSIAWRVAADYPDLVEKLILVDAAGYPLQSKSRPLAFSLARVPVVNKLLTYITPRFIIRKSIENVYVDDSKITEGLVDRYFELACRAGNRQAFVDNLNQIPTDASAKIKTIAAPTLILWGAQDLLIPVDYAHRFHADLPQNTLLIFNNLGHVPMEEDPAGTVGAVKDFLKKKD